MKLRLQRIRENVVCKKQPEIAFNGRGPAGKCFGKDHCEDHLCCGGGKQQTLSAAGSRGSRSGERVCDLLC